MHGIEHILNFFDTEAPVIGSILTKISVILIITIWDLNTSIKGAPGNIYIVDSFHSFQPLTFFLSNVIINIAQRHQSLMQRKCSAVSLGFILLTHVVEFINTTLEKNESKDSRLQLDNPSSIAMFLYLPSISIWISFLSTNVDLLSELYTFSKSQDVNSEKGFLTVN